MKILIAFCTSSGNSEKIARSMKEALNQEDVDLIKVDYSTIINLGSYDLIILGSGIYLGHVCIQIIDLVRNSPKFPSKFAFFYSRQRKEPYPNAFNPIKEIFESNGSGFLGEFNCLGEYFSPYSNEEFEDAQVNFKEYGLHPDEKDLNKARIFAKSLIKFK